MSEGDDNRSACDRNKLNGVHILCTCRAGILNFPTWLMLQLVLSCFTKERLMAWRVVTWEAKKMPRDWMYGLVFSKIHQRAYERHAVERHFNEAAFEFLESTGWEPILLWLRPEIDSYPRNFVTVITINISNRIMKDYTIWYWRQHIRWLCLISNVSSTLILKIDFHFELQPNLKAKKIKAFF